jgi:hypothetical protein
LGLGSHTAKMWGLDRRIIRNTCTIDAGLEYELEKRGEKSTSARHLVFTPVVSNHDQSGQTEPDRGVGDRGSCPEHQNRGHKNDGKKKNECQGVQNDHLAQGTGIHKSGSGDRHGKIGARGIHNRPASIVVGRYSLV